jgi:hypothetical protein
MMQLYPSLQRKLEKLEAARSPGAVRLLAQGRRWAAAACLQPGCWLEQGLGECCGCDGWMQWLSSCSRLAHHAVSSYQPWAS